MVTAFGLEQYFHHTIIAGRDGMSKPHPEIINYLEQLTMISRNQFLIIGDSRHHDIKLGRQAFVDTCLVTAGGCSCPHATYAVSSTQEVVSLVYEKGSHFRRLAWQW